MNMKIHEMTALRLISAMRAGEVSVRDAARACVGRIARFDAALNAVLALAPDWEARAGELERGDKTLPLYGLPVLVKENIDVAGMPTSAGCVFLSDNIAARDADVVKNLRSNGALILGKTNMTEFANYVSFDMPNGYSSRGGQVKAAYAGISDASGSSTGSAVAVSAGFCPVAVGTDTSFSVVGCATIHGLVGVKPPIGALSSRGIVPIAATLDSAGVFAHNLTDALAVCSVMRGAPPVEISAIPAEKLKIGANISGREVVSEAQIARYSALFDRLRTSGASVRDFDMSVPREHVMSIMRFEFKRDLGAYLESSAAKLKTLAGIVAAYESEPSSMPYGIGVLRESLDCEDSREYDAAMSARERLRAELLPALGEFDACVMQGPAQIMHLLGLPSLALPMCMADDGTPRGVILYGADEKRLYGAALTIERHCLPIEPPPLD